MAFGPGGPARGGWGGGIPPLLTVDQMGDPGVIPTLEEGLALGVGKAHRGVVYAHMEFRNYKRDALARTGRVR